MGYAKAMLPTDQASINQEIVAIVEDQQSIGTIDVTAALIGHLMTHAEGGDGDTAQPEFGPCWQRPR